MCQLLFLKQITEWHGCKGGDDAENDNKGNELLDLHLFHKYIKIIE